jgi:hypothetical protein
VEDADSLGALARLKVLPARNLGADGAVPDAVGDDQLDGAPERRAS